MHTGVSFSGLDRSISTILKENKKRKRLRVDRRDMKSSVA